MKNLNQYHAKYRIIFYNGNTRLDSAKAITNEFEVPFSSIPFHAREIAESIRHLQELIYKPRDKITRHRVKLLTVRVIQ